MLWESKLSDTTAADLLENVPLPFYEQRATLVLQSHDVVAQKVRQIEEVSEVVQDTALAPSSIIDDRYVLVEIIGRGGMTIVYVAHDILDHTDSEVAIKFLMPRKGKITPDLISTFEYSAHMNRMLTTDRFPEYRGSGIHAGYHYVVNEYISGANLEHLLFNYPSALPLEYVRDIGIQICYAIQDMSLDGMVHRDIKPSNIMLTNEGEIKLIDFDLLVHQKHFGEFESEELLSSGTATYMSPEQCSFEVLTEEDAEKVEGDTPRLADSEARNDDYNTESAPLEVSDSDTELVYEDDDEYWGVVEEEGLIDTRSDIYNLGATLYQLVTKRPPFRYLTRKRMLEAHLNEAPSPLEDIPTPLAEIIMKALEKDPDNRFQSAAEMRLALEELKDL